MSSVSRRIRRDIEEARHYGVHPVLSQKHSDRVFKRDRARQRNRIRDRFIMVFGLRVGTEIFQKNIDQGVL